MGGGGGGAVGIRAGWKILEKLQYKISRTKSMELLKLRGYPKNNCTRTIKLDKNYF